MEKSHVKILNSNPVKAENRLKKEIEKIQSLIKKYENDEDPYSKLEQALRTIRNKSNDAIRLWIIANALDNLEMSDIALEFKVKADELGYSVTVDEKRTWPEEHHQLMLNVNFRSNISMSDFKKNIESLISSFDETNEAGIIDYNLEAHSVKSEMDASNETASTTASTTTNEAAGMTIRFTKNDLNKMVLNSDFFYITEGDKYLIRSEKTYNNENLGIWDSLKEELTVIYANLLKWLKQNSYINSNHNEGQEFIYNEKDLQPWSMFQQTSDEERAKPEYTTTAVLKMTQDVPILRFAYSQLTSGDNDKDAKMIYNTYIKSDDDLVDKLKTYESYVMSIYEFVSNSPYAEIVYDTLTAYQVEPSDEDTKKLLSLVVNKMTRALTKQIEYERSVFALYTSDVKQSLYDTFKDMDVIDIVEQFKKSGFDIDNVDALNFDAENILNLPDAAKNLVRDTIKSVDYTDALYLDDSLATIVYTTMIAIILKEMVGLSITKSETTI